MKKNEVQEAIRVYENILKIESEDIEILDKLREIYFNEGLIDKAIQACMRLADIYTNQGLLDKVIILYERLLDWEPGNNDVRLKVIEIYRKILQVDPGNLQARHKLINNLIALEDFDRLLPEFIALGETYLEKNLYDEGIGACQKVFEFDAKNVEAHKLLADIYVKQGLTDVAKEEYLMTMNLYREMGSHDKANETYQRMTTLFPDSADMHYELAMTYLEKGEFDESIKEFKLVLESDPQHVPTLSKLGEIYIEKSMLEEGIDHFKKVLASEPTETEIRKKLIDVYLSIDQIDQAMENLLELGDAYVEQRNFEKAIDVYRRILCYIPDSLEAREKVVTVYDLQGNKAKAKLEYIFLANVYDRKNLHMKSIEMCKRVLDMDEGDISVRKKLCTYYVKQGIADIAIKEYNELADLYMTNGFPSSAIEMYQSIIDLKPDNHEIRVKLTELLKTEGKLEDAVKQYFSLIEKYMKEDNISDAIELYRAIIGLKPDDIVAYHKLSELHLQFKEIDKAVSVLEDLANVYSNNDEVEKLIETYHQIGDLYLSEKQIDSALSSYEKVINIYSEKNNEKETIPFYRKIIETLTSKDEVDKALKVQKDLASVFIKAGDLESSIKEYKDIIDTYIKMNKLPETIELYRVLIDNYMKLDNIPLAIDECRQIVSVYLENKMNSQAVEIYSLLVDIYLKQDKVLESSEVLSIIGDIYLSENNTEQAIENLERAANGFSGKEKYNEAIEVYKKISGLAPEYLENRFRLIELYNKISCSEKAVEEYCSLIKSQAESGNLEKAADIFQESIKDNNSEPVLYNCMANIYFDNQKWDEAIENYKKVLESEDKYPGVYSRLTLTCARKGDLDGAVEWTKKLITSGKVYEILEDFPSNSQVNLEKAEAYYNWGLIYKRVGFIQDSIRAFIASSKYPSKKLNSLKMIGECFFQEGFTELAVRQFRQILDISLDSTGMTDEDYLELRYNLGKVLEKMGRFKDSKKAFEGICEINIKYKDTMEKIMELTRKIETMKETDVSDPKVIEFSFEEE